VGGRGSRLPRKQVQAGAMPARSTHLRARFRGRIGAGP